MDVDVSVVADCVRIIVCDCSCLLHISKVPVLPICQGAAINQEGTHEDQGYGVPEFLASGE